MRGSGSLHPLIWEKLESDPELIELERRSLEAAADVNVALSWGANHRRTPTTLKTPGDTARGAHNACGLWGVKCNTCR